MEENIQNMTEAYALYLHLRLSRKSSVIFEDANPVLQFERIYLSPRHGVHAVNPIGVVRSRFFLEAKKYQVEPFILTLCLSSISKEYFAFFHRLNTKDDSEGPTVFHTHQIPAPASFDTDWCTSLAELGWSDIGLNPSVYRELFGGISEVFPG